MSTKVDIGHRPRAEAHAPQRAVGSAAVTTGARVDGPAVARRRLPAWADATDLGIALALAGWGFAEVVLAPLPPVSGSAFVLLSTLPLAVRRRWPGPVLVLVSLVLVAFSAVLSGTAGATFTPFPSLLLAAFTVAALVPALPLAAVLGALPVVAMGAAGQLGYFGAEGAQPRAVAIAIFFVASAWTGGRLVRHRALAAQRAEEGSAAAADQAVALERARIARELHDVVAHSVSVVVLQTGAAEQFVVRDPDRALAHLGMARRTAAEAMREMRHLLDVLREGEASYLPQPGISRLTDLVRDARDAGVAVDLSVTGDEEVPDGPSLAAYRLVQESLTNVLKHAPGARVEVRVAVTATELTVEVRDDGGDRTTHHRPVPAGDLADGGGGHGLPGMRERVRVYGGSLTAGPAGRGWEVRAVLPLGAS
jgi:signal transduction histidine kinase